MIAAILNFCHPVTSYSFHSSVIVFFAPENMSITVETSLLSCLQAEIWVTLGLVAAILVLLLLVTSDSFHSNVIASPVPENMGIAFDISLLSCLRTEIQVNYGWRPTSSTCKHWRPYWIVEISAIESGILENHGVGLGLQFPRASQSELA